MPTIREALPAGLIEITEIGDPYREHNFQKPGTRLGAILASALKQRATITVDDVLIPSGYSTRRVRKIEEE